MPKAKFKKASVSPTDLEEDSATKPILRYRIMHKNAYGLTRETPNSVGYDLRSPYDYLLPPRVAVKIPIGLQMAIPYKHYGRIAPKSGLAARFAIDVLAGVIDPDYRGEIVVILINHGATEVQLFSGQKIAQLILEKASIANLKEEDRLEDTYRGDRGLGNPKT